MATNASVELGGYQAALEEVLTWLLAAEDSLITEQNSVKSEQSDALVAAKEKFHGHEAFLQQLAEHQVCDCILYHRSTVL
jgi:dystrophin